MIERIAKVKTIRSFMLEMIKELGIEQLNEIPERFNNNVIWNLGHMIAAQQGLCYARAGVKLFVDQTFIDKYKAGTKPEHFVDNAEIETIKHLLISTLDQFEADIKSNLFTNYTPFTTRYGVEIKTLAEAMDFVPFHDGLHIGSIMGLRKFLKKGV